MTTSEAETKRIALCSVLKAIKQILNDHAEDHWCKIVCESLQLIEQRDFHGVELILGCFGGMGSLNDLILNTKNGHDALETEQSSLNDRLNDLLEQVYEVSSSLSHYHARSSH